MFSVAAVVTFVGSTFLPGLAQAETPDTELGHAYEWAHSKGITTMDTYEKANMYGAITRAEMAKMLSVYATEILGKKADTSKACEFSDIASVGGDLKDFIVKSCQLSVMGQNITAFRPYDTITRAEFGTALSRVLWGDTYNNGTPYYANHLNALKEAGIMKQIANADSTKEIRGYVMIMLQRASEGEDKDLCEMCLATGIGADKCEAVCGSDNNEEEDNNDEVVKSGDIAVSSSAAEDRSVIVPGTSDLDTLTFKTSEEVTLNKVVLERYWFSNNTANIDGIWLEDEDGNVITTSQTNTPNSKGLVNLSLKKDYKTVDGTLNATIVIKMSTVANETPSGTIGFKVSDVTSSAKNVDLGNYKAYTYDVVKYDGSVATVSARGWEKEHNYEAGKSYEVSKFKVKAPEGSAILVKSFTFKDAWNLNTYDFLDIDSVKVTVAGKTVKATASIDKSEELTVSFKEDVEIAAKQNVEFIITSALNSDFDKYGSTIKFNMTNISATDKNNARITINPGATKFVEYKFLGGKVKFTNNKLGNVESAINSDNVLIADGTIELTEDLKGSATIKITQSSFVSGGTNYYPAQNIKEIRLVIAGDENVGTFYTDAACTTKWANADPVYVKFDNLEISESGKVRVYVDIDDDANYEDKSMTFGSIEWNLQYEEDNNTTPAEVDKSGTISVSKLTFQKSEGSLTNTISSDEVEFKKGSSETKEIFKGAYTAKKSAIKLNKFTLSGNWVANTADSGKNPMHVYLYVDGNEVADAKLSCTSLPCIASDTFSDVLVDANASVDVRVEAEVNGTDLRDTVKFTLTLEGEDENDNPAGIASKQSAKVLVVEKGTPEVEKGTANNTVLVRGKDNTIATMTVKPSGASSSIDLESVYFDKWSNDCSKIKLIVGNTDKSFADAKDSSNNDICKVDGFEEEIRTAGKVLSIEFDEEPDESTTLKTADVNNLYLNDTKVNGSFSKAYADAVISFNQSKKDDITEYTVANIEKYSSTATISDLHFYDADNNELVINGITPTTELAVSDTFTIANTKSSVYVKKIAYTVKRWTTFTQNVVVEYSTYKDFFKTNDGDLRTYAYGDAESSSTNTVAPILSAPTSLPTVVAGWLDVTSIDNVQQNIVIDNANKKITGTLKKLTSANAQNAGASVTYGHVLYIKVDNATAWTTKVWINNPGVLDDDKDVSITVTDTSKKLRVALGWTTYVEYDLSGLTLEA